MWPISASKFMWNTIYSVSKHHKECFDSALNTNSMAYEHHNEYFKTLNNGVQNTDYPNTFFVVSDLNAKSSVWAIWSTKIGGNNGTNKCYDLSKDFGVSRVHIFYSVQFLFQSALKSSQ